jgi:hypothetical protein
MGKMAITTAGTRNDTSQSGTVYRPNSNEKKLLQVLLNPENRLKTITDICDIAGCDRKTYYRAFKKKELVDYYTAESRALVRHSLAPVINACIKQAIKGSAPHAKILLTMAGEYSESSRVTFPDKDGKPQPVGGVFNYLEMATRITYILEQAAQRKAAEEAKSVDIGEPRAVEDKMTR